MTPLCPCGDPHLDKPIARLFGEDVLAQLAETVDVTVQGVGAWSVPRVWIAFHGLRATDVPALADKYGWERVA